MSESSSYPEPPPQNELERLLAKAASDPVLHGPLFRMLWEAELFTFIPDHPEMHGEFPLENGDGFVFCKYPHADGPFMAVFTSDAAADWAGAQIPPPAPAIAGMPGEALFRMANDGTTWVRVNHGMPGTITLDPAGVAALVRGEFTRRHPGGGGAKEVLTLDNALPVEFPAAFLEPIHRFCAQRLGGIGVYAFYVGQEKGSAIDFNDVRLVLWLRESDDHFYNDFAVMVGKIAPPYLRVTCHGVTAGNPEHAGTLAFLHRCTPLWPSV